MVRLDNVHNMLTLGGGYLTNHINKHEMKLGLKGSLSNSVGGTKN